MNKLFGDIDITTSETDVVFDRYFEKTRLDICNDIVRIINDNEFFQDTDTVIRPINKLTYKIGSANDAYYPDYIITFEEYSHNIDKLDSYPSSTNICFNKKGFVLDCSKQLEILCMLSTKYNAAVNSLNYMVVTKETPNIYTGMKLKFNFDRNSMDNNYPEIHVYNIYNGQRKEIHITKISLLYIDERPSLKSLVSTISAIIDKNIDMQIDISYVKLHNSLKIYDEDCNELTIINKDNLKDLKEIVDNL